jgi:hypothetical protein
MYILRFRFSPIRSQLPQICFSFPPHYSMCCEQSFYYLQHTRNVSCISAILSFLTLPNPMQLRTKLLRNGKARRRFPVADRSLIVSLILCTLSCNSGSFRENLLLASMLQIRLSTETLKNCCMQMTPPSSFSLVLRSLIRSVSSSCIIAS